MDIMDYGPKTDLLIDESSYAEQDFVQSNAC